VPSYSRLSKCFAAVAVLSSFLFPLICHAGKGAGRELPKGERIDSLPPPDIKYDPPRHPNIGGLLPTVVSYGVSFNPLKGVLAYDFKDGYIDDIKVVGSVDTKKVGTVSLSYSVTNSAGDTKTVKRRVTVLPKGAFAVLSVTGRKGPGKIVRLGKSYQGRLADDVTFIKPVVFALPGAEHYFRLIERGWGSSGHNSTPPTAEDWKAAKEERFYRDLYLCLRPRLDRWLKVTVRYKGKSISWVYGLKGDPGVKFHSPYTNKDYWRLSKKVDDPITAKDSFPLYSQSTSYWCPFSFYLEKMMGGRAHVTTIGDVASAYDAANREELHGFHTTIRAFMKGCDKRNQSPENWKKMTAQWEHAFGVAMNASFRRSFQIPTAEMNGGDAGDYLREFTSCYETLRKKYNPERVIVVTLLRGQAAAIVKFPYLDNPYFKSEWHKGHFEAMFQKFVSYEKMLKGGIVQYPRMNEVWNKKQCFTLLETHRRIHKFAQEHNVEMAILDKIGNLGRYKNGEWSSFSLAYYATWFCYSGYDYLNNGPFFADDWDGDGLPNDKERALGTNPFHPDTDGDMIFDGMEIEYGLNPKDPSDAAKDNDHDRMSNFDEIVAGTRVPGAGAGTGPHPALELKTASGKILKVDPNNPVDASWDPDKDMLPAWFEVNTGLDPTRFAMLKNGFKGFSDQPDPVRLFAGLPAIMAYHYGIDKNDMDYDGDGVSNIDELKAGRDPTAGKSSSDPRAERWAKMGGGLFKRYFKPEQYDGKFAKGKNGAFAFFAYSPTESGITADFALRGLECDALSPEPTSEKVEVLMARMMGVLKELRSHPELWKDQKKIVVGITSRTYLKRGKLPCLREDRGLYIHIPVGVFAGKGWKGALESALKGVGSKPPKSVKCGKGRMFHDLYLASSGIKTLFFDSQDKGYADLFGKKSKRGKKGKKGKKSGGVTGATFQGDHFDYGMFKAELGKLGAGG